MVAGKESEGGPATQVYLLDYGGGNVRSVINAVAAAGYPSLKLIKTADDFAKVRCSFSACVSRCMCVIGRPARARE